MWHVTVFLERYNAKIQEHFMWHVTVLLRNAIIKKFKNSFCDMWRFHWEMQLLQNSGKIFILSYFCVLINCDMWHCHILGVIFLLSYNRPYIDVIYGIYGISVNWNLFPSCQSSMMVFAVQYPILWSSLLTRAVPWNTKLKVLKYRPRLQGPCVEKRGLNISRYGTGNPVSKHEHILNIHWEVTDNFPKNYFHEIRPKSFSQAFLLILKFSESCLKTHQGFSEK